MTEEKGAQSASAGGVYVSRPGGDSGFAPSLVTTTSPDHPSNRVATENAASASFRMPSDQMREQYEKISRDVIQRLVPGPVAALEALERLDELLTIIDRAMAEKEEGEGAPGDAAAADAAAKPAGNAKPSGNAKPAK